MEDPAPSFCTQYLHDRIDRWRAGDRDAADELLRATAGRLERLARQKLRGFPAVRGWAETGDILAGATLRLLTALKTVTPTSTRHYFQLSGCQMRFELLTLARRVARRVLAELEQPATVVDERAADVEELERWALFHQAIDELPDQQREVISLLFYDGMKLKQVAEVVGVSEKTAGRYKKLASRRLHARLGGHLPRIDG